MDHTRLLHLAGILTEAKKPPVDNSPLAQLKRLPQPVGINGGSYTYWVDVTKTPLKFTASDGDVVDKAKTLKDIAKWLDSHLAEVWLDFLNGDEDLEFLKDEGVIRAKKGRGDQQEHEAGMREALELKEAEKKHYIVSNGSRVAGPFDTEKEADDELLKRQKRAKPEDEFGDAKVVCEGKVAALNETEKKFAAAVREFFLNTLKDKKNNPDSGMDVIAYFNDEWLDLPHAVEHVVRNVLKSEKAGVLKTLKSS
jgi:hypothetical protein